MVEPIDRNILLITEGYNPSDTSYVVDLQTAVDQIASANGTLVIDGPIALTASVTVPSNILLKISNKQAYIDHGAFTLTINGPFQCGRWTAFSGAGSVVFGAGSTDKIYPEWKGAVPDGTTDCNTAIQWAVNTSANSNGETVDFGSGIYYSSGDIYLAYDATYNTGYPSAARKQGRMILIGKGPATTDNANNNEKVRTVINFDSNKGFKGTATASSTIKNLYIKNLSIWGNTTDWLIDLQFINWSGYKDLFVYNASSTGNGIRWQNTFHINWKRVWVKAPTGNTGIGVLINSPTSGGGRYVLDHCVSEKFGTTWQLGEPTNGSSSLGMVGWECNITAEDPTTYGVLVGNGVQAMSLSVHAENYGSVGCWLKNSPISVRIHSSEFTSTASTADIQLGDNSASTDQGKGAIAATVEGCHFVIVGTGVVLNFGGTTTESFIIRNNIFAARTASAGAGIDLDQTVPDKQGTIIEANYFGSLASVLVAGTSTQNLIFHRGGGANNYVVNSSFRTFTANDTTPSVSFHSRWQTNNSNPTTITDLDNGSVGQEVFILINDTNTTIDFTGTNLKGNGGSDWSPTTGDSMNCVYNGTNWYCSVSDNTA